MVRWLWNGLEDYEVVSEAVSRVDAASGEGWGCKMPMAGRLPRVVDETTTTAEEQPPFSGPAPALANQKLDF